MAYRLKLSNGLTLSTYDQQSLEVFQNLPSQHPTYKSEKYRLVRPIVLARNVFFSDIVSVPTIP